VTAPNVPHLDPGPVLDEQELSFELGLPDWAERPIMDIPAFPELDGREAPDYLPLTDPDGWIHYSYSNRRIEAKLPWEIWWRPGMAPSASGSGPQP